MARRIVKIECEAVARRVCECCDHRTDLWLRPLDPRCGEDLCCTDPEPFEDLRLRHGDRVLFEARTSKPTGEARARWNVGRADTAISEEMDEVWRDLGIFDRVYNDNREVKVWWRVKRLPNKRSKKS